MSDSDCSSTSDSNCSEFSICEEISELISQLTNIHEQYHNANETLEKIYQLVASANKIYIVHNDKKQDFSHVLEELHSLALERIRQGEKTEFGHVLINIISNAPNRK